MKVSPAGVIRRKREGATLGENELAGFVAGITDGTVSDAQVAAFAMAVCFRGMTREECAAFTAAMTYSGAVLDWSGTALRGPALDKHSTGGVGDKVSLILAPVVAACGGFVPMISGRGLGHTGGTLDKLASIPGYDTNPDLVRFRAAVGEADCAIVGPTADLAPADRRLYPVRDVTATTDSLPLITSSILSKKLAAGIHALVVDVKVGSGALLPSLTAASELAESLLQIAGAAGLPMVALLTDMTQALGHDVGNALEVREAIDFLPGRRRDPRLTVVTVALTAELLCLGGLARDETEAASMIARSTPVPRPSVSRAWLQHSAAPPISSSIPSAIYGQHPCNARSRRCAPASSRRWTRAPSVSFSSISAAVDGVSRTRSMPRSVCPTCAALVTWSRRTGCSR